MNTALFGFISVFGIRNSDSEADVTNAPLNGDPLAGVKAPFLRAEKRKPFAPSTERYADVSINRFKEEANGKNGRIKVREKSIE